MSTRRKKPRKAPASKAMPASNLTEAQKRKIAIVGLSYFIGLAFPTMTPETAVLEAGRHIDAAVSVDADAPRDVAQEVELIAEWLYGLSRRHGKMSLKPMAFDAALEGMQWAMFQHIHYDITDVPRRIRRAMVDSFFEWVRLKRLTTLALCLEADPENSGLALARASLCANLNKAVNVESGTFSWPTTINEMLVGSASVLTDEELLSITGNMNNVASFLIGFRR